MTKRQWVQACYNLIGVSLVGTFIGFVLFGWLVIS